MTNPTITYAMSTNPEPRVAIEDINPAKAEEMLKYNDRNRTFKPNVANMYARDMSNNRWRYNGEAIKFDWNGRLIDGQHRLTAIKQSLTTQRMLVVYDLPPEAQDSLDAGAKRTAADVLSLNGYRDGTTLASVARMALSLDANPQSVRATRGWTNAEVRARIERDPLMTEVITKILPELPRATFALATRSAIGYAYYRLAQLNPGTAADFFNKLGTLANLPADSPILALHRRLNAHMQQTRGPLAAYESVAYIFMAWNAWRRNEPRTVIKLSYTREDGRLRLVQPE